MTPPAAAAAARTRTQRTTPPPRRVSGPARGKQRSTSTRPGAAATIAATPPLALRLGGAVHGIAEHHLLERILRGRAWIAILAVGLMGIVFMQVSMLRMNAGIGQAVDRSAVLERHNAAIRASISELSSGDRIAAEAARMGLILPAGTPRFLDARDADARRALASMTAPGEGIVPTPSDAAAEAAAATGTPTSTVPTLGQSSVAETSVPATATPETTPTTATPATATTTTTAPTATTQPAAAAQQPTSTGQSTTSPAATAAPPPSTASSGGMDASGQVG